jgi:hypothetical protein
MRSVKSSHTDEESDVRHRQYYTQASLLGFAGKRLRTMLA